MLQAVFNQAYPLVRRAVAGRTAAWHLSTWDREDAEQQAALGVWRALSRFDPVRGCIGTFVDCVTRNELASAHRSNWHPEHELIEEHEADFRVPDSRPDLRVDVDRVLSGMESFEQAVAHGLVDYSVTEISRHLGVSRATAYRAIGRLRRAFSSAGYAPASHRHRAQGACR